MIHPTTSGAPKYEEEAFRLSAPLRTPEQSPRTTKDSPTFGISDLRFQAGPRPKASANLNGFRLFFEFPAGVPVLECADAFLVAAMIPAMLSGKPIQVDERFPVSPRLLQSFGALQALLSSWNPKLKPVPVMATKAKRPRQAVMGVCSFFSGGVDSGYTFLQHRDEVSQLVLIQGMADTTLDNPHFPEIEQRLGSLAARFGKQLIAVRTNARDFIEQAGVTMALYHGALLASVALLLGVHRAYVPSSERYDNLYPWGSHPLLDPLWSTDYCQIVHDGCEANRTQKLKRLMESQPLLDALRVCNGDAAYNCGRCVKCVRTAVALNVLGGETAALPPVTVETLEQLGRSYIADAEDAEELFDLQRIAGERGREEVYEELENCLRWWAVKDALRQLDRELLGGKIRQFWGRWCGGGAVGQAAGFEKFDR